MDFHSIDNLAGLEATPQPPVVQQQLPTTTTSGCACDAIAPTTNEQAHYLANYIDNNRQTTRCEETDTNNLQQLPEHASTTSGSVNNDATNSDANGGETRVQIRRKTMDKKNQIVKSPEFIARIKVALSVLNLAILHDLLIRCSSRNVVYDNQQQQTDKKKCRNCNTDEQKTKCIEHKVAEILYRAEKVSAENANQFLAMLSSSSSTKEWHVHILLPRKSNPGAKEQRNTSQKHTPFLFHSVCWQPVAFLCVLKRGIPVLPRMLACVANCNTDSTIPAMTFCINPYHFEPQPSARLPEQQQQPILFNDNQRQQQTMAGTNISEDPEKKALREQNEELRKLVAQFQQQQGQQQHMIAPVAQHAREHDNWQIDEQQTPIASSSIINYPDGNYNNNNHYLQQLAAAAMQASCSSSNMAYPADLPMTNSSWLPPQLANLPSSSNCTINDDNNSSSAAVSSVMEMDDEEDHQSTRSTTSSSALSSAVVAVTDSMASIQLQNKERAAATISNRNANSASMPVGDDNDIVDDSDEIKKRKKFERQQMLKDKKACAEHKARLALAFSGLSDEPLVKMHDLLIECNLLNNRGETKRQFGEGSHTTPMSKAKHMRQMISEFLLKAEQYSPENADNLAVMLADTNGHNWPGHIYWPWKINAGADNARNRRQKQKLNFHHQPWSPEAFLKTTKQRIKVRPVAMEQKCDGNNAAGICINPYHYRSKAGGAFDQQQQAQETQRPFDQPQQRATMSTTTPFEFVPPSSTAGLANASANYYPNTAVAGHQMTTWLQSLGLVSQPPSSLGSLLSTFTAPTSFLHQAPAIAPYAQAVGTGLANAGGDNCFPPNTAAGPPPTMMPQTPGQLLSSPPLSLENMFSTVTAPTLLQQAPAIAPYAQAAAACSQFFAQLPPGTMNSMLSTAAATVQQSQQQLPHQLTQPQQLPSNLLNTFPTTAGPLSNNTYLSQLLANILLKNQQPPGGGGGNTQ